MTIVPSYDRRDRRRHQQRHLVGANDSIITKNTNSTNQQYNQYRDR
jgi:hypothetical protein